jgi:hypothetical protein
MPLFFLLNVISIFSSIFTLIPSPLIVSYFTVFSNFFFFCTLTSSLCQTFSSRYLSYFHFPRLIIFFCTQKQKYPFFASRVTSKITRQHFLMLNKQSIHNTDCTTLLLNPDGEPGIKFNRM